MTMKVMMVAEVVAFKVRGVIFGPTSARSGCPFLIFQQLEKLLKASRHVLRRNICIILRCMNFLVYEDATLEPGPGLNLLVGPNGSGKTTWANAILIGLGASPKV
jgi:hypothetical protein